MNATTTISAPPVRPRVFDEDQAIERAMELFWRRGYRSASLPMLLKETGLARGTLYRAFGDKRGLFQRAFARYTERRLARLDELLARQSTPLQGLRAMIESWRGEASQADYAGCLLMHSVGEFSGTDEAELRGDALAAFAEVERRLVAALRAAVDRGELPPTFAVDATAHALLGSACAVVTFGRADVRPDVVDGILDSAHRLIAA